MHPLNDVPAIVEHSLDVLRIDGACEVRITIVLAVAARCTYTLKTFNIEISVARAPGKFHRQDSAVGVADGRNVGAHEWTLPATRLPSATREMFTYEKLVPNEVLGPYNVRRFRGIRDNARLNRCLVSCELWKIVL